MNLLMKRRCWKDNLGSGNFPDPNRSQAKKKKKKKNNNKRDRTTE